MTACHTEWMLPLLNAPQVLNTTAARTYSSEGFGMGWVRDAATRF